MWQAVCTHATEGVRVRFAFKKIIHLWKRLTPYTQNSVVTNLFFLDCFILLKLKKTHNTTTASSAKFWRLFELWPPIQVWGKKKKKKSKLSCPWGTIIVTQIALLQEIGGCNEILFYEKEAAPQTFRCKDGDRLRLRNMQHLLSATGWTLR